jgi:hypothetical protein
LISNLGNEPFCLLVLDGCSPNAGQKLHGACRS